MKYEEEYKGKYHRELRKYPKSSWGCRRDRNFRECHGKDVCIQWYPNLICEHGFREQL